MRRFLSILMAIFLLIPCFSLAEALPAETESTYTHPALAYSLTPAEGWLLLDESIVNGLLNDLAEGNSPFSTETLQQFYAQLNGTVVTIAYAPNGQLNLVIGPEVFGFDADIQTLAPALLEGIKASLPVQSPVFEDEGSIVRFGETDYLRLCMTYEQGGLFFRACQYVAARDGVGYYLTFTATDSSSPLSMEEIETAALPFLDSFRMPEVSPYAVYGSIPYTHPDEGYGLSVPANWLAIDRQNIASLLAQSPDNPIFQYVAPQIEAHNLMMAYRSDSSDNVNILTEPVDPDATIQKLAISLMLSVGQGYSSFENVSFLDKGSIVRFGETNFFRCSAQLTSDGFPLHINQYFACHNGTLYTLTLTCNGSYTVEIMDAIARPFLESFSFPD